MTFKNLFSTLQQRRATRLAAPPAASAAAASDFLRMARQYGRCHFPLTDNLLSALADAAIHEVAAEDSRLRGQERACVIERQHRLQLQGQFTLRDPMS